MLKSKLFTVLILVGMATTMAHSAAPVVSNVEVQQLPASHDVEVNFDVYDADNDMVQMLLMFSTDGGQTWPVRCDSLSGDVWIDNPGPGKTIIWHAGGEVPDFQSSNCRLRLFATDDNARPWLYFFKVTETDTLAMTDHDTIGYGEPLHLLWKGSTAIADGLDPVVLEQMDTAAPFDDGIVGYKWRHLQDYCNPDFEDCWHPRYYDEATGDSLSYFGAGHSLSFSNDNTGTDVFRKRLDSGQVPFAINAQDIVQNEVPEFRQEFSFTVNYNPITVLLDGETDWAHPEDTQVYPYYIRLNDPTQAKVPFTSGDRIPDRTYVVFKALFKDDPRDLILNPDEMGSTGHFLATRHNLTGGLFSFQSQASPIDYDPDWDMSGDGWFADTLGFLTSPNCDFSFYMQGVDEHGRRDGPGDNIDFSVGLPPCVQCIEILPGMNQPSAFTQDLDCYFPDGGGNECFTGENIFYIKDQGGAELPGRTYLDPLGSLTYLAIDRATMFAQFMDESPDPGQYYSFTCIKYSLGVYLHGQDNLQEAWADPMWRSMAWKYQVDYDCDPLNSIADGGGNDSLLSTTWGADYDNDLLEIDPTTGLWRMNVEVMLPQQLVTLGATTFRQVIQFTMANGDPELTDELYNICIRQLSAGTVSAIALDQTRCDVPPFGRPAKYHVFHTVRPPVADPGPDTWRACNPFWGYIQYSLDLDQGAMQSLGGQAVEQPFQLILQENSGADITCDPEAAAAGPVQPAWYEVTR